MTGAGGDSRLAPLERDLPAEHGAAPVVLHRDPDLLVVAKPRGWLTHPDGVGGRPSVTEALGGGLGVHQRLDVGVSGALAFSLSRAGARALQGAGRKRYLAVVEGRPPCEGRIERALDGRRAVTCYRLLRGGRGWAALEITPETGRTHQIRRHLAGIGHPIRGDGRFGDPIDPRAPRLMLHCRQLVLPGGAVIEAAPPAAFQRYLGGGGAREGLAAAGPEACYRLVNGAADGHPGWTLDRYGEWGWLVAQVGAEGGERAPPLRESLAGLYQTDAGRDRSMGGQAPPRLVAGVEAPRPLAVREGPVRYLVELAEQLSCGLFLDHRPQRLWLARHAGGARVLNTFAHAGAFSVAAAVGGASTVSVDLSRGWLERLGPQLAFNGIDPAPHRTIRGDVIDWLGRLDRRGERFDVVILDPPGTSVGRRGRRWSAARDYGALAAQAARLVAPGGTLWTCCNLRKLGPGRFARVVAGGLPASARLERVGRPALDFPVDDHPAPLKTLIWRLPEGGASGSS